MLFFWPSIFNPETNVMSFCRSLQYWHTVVCISHATILDLCYFSFELLVHYKGDDKRTIFQGENAHIFITYTYFRQIIGCTDHDSTPAPVMMQERISAEVARMVANFLTIVSPSQTHIRMYAWVRMHVCGCGCTCVRLAWLCHDSSLQFVRWSKATAGVWENITAGSSG